MNPTLYLIGQLIVALLAFGLIHATTFGLRVGLAKLAIPKKKRQQLIQYIRGGLVFWLAIMGLLAYFDFFAPNHNFPPRVAFALVPPILLAFYLAFFSRLVRLLLKVIPERWLIQIQTFRIFMELFLWMGYLGSYVPPQMTFLWLNQDIIVGLTAPFAGWLFFGRQRYQKPEGVMWNIFGIALLLNVLVIGIFSNPSPFRVFLNEPSSIFVNQFPFIWMVSFIVPFALAMHLLSLRQLLTNTTRPVSRRFLANRRLFK